MLCPTCEIDRTADVTEGRRQERCKNPKCLQYQKPVPVQYEEERAAEEQI